MIFLFSKLYINWAWLSDFTFSFHFHLLEKEMATHSSILAWRIPGIEELGRLPSMGSHRVGHNWSDLAAAAAAAQRFWPRPSVARPRDFHGDGKQAFLDLTRTSQSPAFRSPQGVQGTRTAEVWDVKWGNVETRSLKRRVERAACSRPAHSEPTGTWNPWG